MNTIRVNRSHLPYQVEKLLVTDWLAILGPIGFSIYNLYRCLADDQEIVTPSIRQVAALIQISSTYVQLHNKLLVYCGLIEIVPGNQGKSNAYVLCSVPAVTPELITKIKKRAAKDKQMKARAGFLRSRPRQPLGLFDRLDNYQPIASIPAVTIKEETKENDPDILERLMQLRGIGDKFAQQLLNNYESYALAAWLDWFENQGAKIGNQAGYLYTALSNGDNLPPVEIGTVNLCKLCQKPTEDTYCADCRQKYNMRH